MKESSLFTEKILSLSDSFRNHFFERDILAVFSARCNGIDEPLGDLLSDVILRTDLQERTSFQIKILET